MLARGKSWPPALLMWEKLISCSPAQEESGCPPAHFPLSRTKLRDEAEQQGLLRAWQSQPPPVLTLAWLMSSSMRSCSWPAEALRMACMFSFSTHSCCRSHLQDSQVTPRAPAHAEVPHRPSGNHKTPLPPKHEEKPHIYSFNPHGPLGLPLPFYPIPGLVETPKSTSHHWRCLKRTAPHPLRPPESLLTTLHTFWVPPRAEAPHHHPPGPLGTPKPTTPCEGILRYTPPTPVTLCRPPPPISGPLLTPDPLGNSRHRLRGGHLELIPPHPSPLPGPVWPPRSRARSPHPFPPASRSSVPRNARTSASASAGDSGSAAAMASATLLWPRRRRRREGPPPLALRCGRASGAPWRRGGVPAGCGTHGGRRGHAGTRGAHPSRAGSVTSSTR